MTYDFLIKKRKIIVVAQIQGVNDTRNFNFILDTGATKTIIGERVATTLGYELYRLQRGDRLMTAGGGIHSKILKLKKLRLIGKDLINFEVSVIQFPLQITVLADGLIGMDFLLKFKNIKFDFEAKTIET